MQRCIVGQLLWQDIDAAILRTPRKEDGHFVTKFNAAIDRAFYAYFTHKHTCADCKAKRTA